MPSAANLKVAEASNAYVVEMNVPLPEDGRGPRKTPERVALEALHVAKIGASVFIPAAEHNRRANDRINAKAAAIAGPGWYSTRKVEGGYRVWKVR